MLYQTNSGNQIRNSIKYEYCSCLPGSIHHCCHNNIIGLTSTPILNLNPKPISNNYYENNNKNVNAAKRVSIMTEKPFKYNLNSVKDIKPSVISNSNTSINNINSSHNLSQIVSNENIKSESHIINEVQNLKPLPKILKEVNKDEVVEADIQNNENSSYLVKVESQNFNGRSYHKILGTPIKTFVEDEFLMSNHSTNNNFTSTSKNSSYGHRNSSVRKS